MTLVARGRSLVGIGVVLALALTGCSGGGGGSNGTSAAPTTIAPATTTPSTSPVVTPPPTPAPTAPFAPKPAPGNPKPQTNAAPVASYKPTGALVADSGFRPEIDGLPFQNYGRQLADGTAPTNLTVEDMRRMFSDAVCVAGGGPACALIPEAQQWLTSTNQQMASGHCYGFSVAAMRFWQKQTPVSTFGAAATTALSIANNTPLQRGIAYAWATQLLPSVRKAVVTGPPNLMLQRLRSVLTPNAAEVYTVGFSKRDGTGGHAVTPYAVEDKGGGKFNVLIYDNNLPAATQAIAFDTNSNTWQYVAQINPKVQPTTYDGDAKSQTLFLYPASPGFGTQPCPFCNRQNSTHPAGINSLATAASASRAATAPTWDPLESTCRHASLSIL